MILRIILLLILAYFGIKSILAIARYLKRPDEEPRLKSTTRRAPINEMTQDPVCGMYIPKQEALSHRGPNGTVYFCSEECKKKFLHP